MDQIIGIILFFVCTLYLVFWFCWSLNYIFNIFFKKMKEKNKEKECKHQWLAKSYGKRDENTGKYLGRACICMHCHKEALFSEPLNGVINW